MKITSVRNTALRSGMRVQVDGRVKTVKRISFANFDTSIVEFADGCRSAVNLRSSSLVLQWDKG